MLRALAVLLVAQLRSGFWEALWYWAMGSRLAAILAFVEVLSSIGTLDRKHNIYTSLIQLQAVLGCHTFTEENSFLEILLEK